MFNALAKGLRQAANIAGRRVEQNSSLADSATKLAAKVPGVTFQRDSLNLAATSARQAVTKKVMTGKQVVTLLEDNGFALGRIKGSHHIMVRDNLSIPVPVHGHDDLGKGLLAAILKQAGLK